MIRDGDGIYGERVTRRIESLGIDEVVTAPASPWQNPYVERVIGTLRRELFDHVYVVVSELLPSVANTPVLGLRRAGRSSHTSSGTLQRCRIPGRPRTSPCLSSEGCMNIRDQQDGLYVDGTGSTARFRWVKAPTNDELAQLTRTMPGWPPWCPSPEPISPGITVYSHPTASTGHGLRRQSGAKAINSKRLMSRETKPPLNAGQP